MKFEFGSPISHSDIHYNAHSVSKKKKGFNYNNLTKWPIDSRDSNLIKNLGSIIKMDAFDNRKQYSSNEDIWKVIETAAGNVKVETIKKVNKINNWKTDEVDRMSRSTH